MLTWINLSVSTNQEISRLIMNLGNIFSDSLMGKLLLKLKIILLRSETYNRVDKINMNNTKIVSPEKTGRNHFALAEEIR